MRYSTRAIHTRLLTLIALALCASFGIAQADDRAQAKARFQAGVKAYGSGDFRLALKEFATAQQLSPADLNYYNLALCHDKLGEAESAIQNYQEYLRRVPDAPKRAEIEASIARLDDALRSVAKKAEEAKRVEAAKRAETDQRAREESNRVEGAGPPVPTNPPPVPANAVPAEPSPASGAGASGTPSTGLTVTTGDAQLDRVASMNVDAIRDQRGLSGRPVGTAQGATPSGGPGAARPVQPSDAPPKAKPIYKQWWFWAVVAVGAIVAYEVATTSSNSATRIDNPGSAGVRSTPDQGVRRKIEGREVPQASAGAPQANIPLFRF